jgi:hypothetical protein
LYGHPESGGHWENHLTAAIKQIGGEPIDDHPSSFWFPKERLIMSVYVDDLLLSGPEDAHDELWSRIKEAGIKLDDPEPVERFLGRTHIVI